MFEAIYNKIVDWMTFEEEPAGLPQCDYERIRYEIRPCDVLLIEGRSKVSEIIKIITQSAWSHSALYLGRIHDISNPNMREIISQFFKGSENTQLLLEGVMGKGTIITPLDHYKKDHIRICRPRGLAPRDAERVKNYAISRLGTEYDVRQIIDLARLLLPWSIIPRKWRSNLFEQGSTYSHTICSTIIAEAFASVDFPILPHITQHREKGLELIPRNPKLFTPRDFDYSPYFDIIKYPFLEIDEHTPYRKLPWNREGLVSHDEHIFYPIRTDSQESNDIDDNEEYLPPQTD